MADYVPGSMNTLAACSICRAVFYDGKDAIVRANDHEASCKVEVRRAMDDAEPHATAWKAFACLYGLEPCDRPSCIEGGGR